MHVCVDSYFKRICYVTLGGLKSVGKVEALVGLYVYRVCWVILNLVV